MPTYSCENCVFFLRKHGVKPACQTKAGCQIGEFGAKSWEVNFIVNNYLLASRLQIGDRVSEVPRKLLDEAGLLDDIELLTRMDVAYMEFRHQKSEQERRSQKSKTTTKWR